MYFRLVSKWKNFPPIFMLVNKKDFYHLLLSDWDFHPFHKRTCQKEKTQQNGRFFLGAVLMSCSFLKGSNEQKIANTFGVPSKDRNLVEIWFDSRKNHWLKDDPFLLELGLFSGAT